MSRRGTTLPELNPPAPHPLLSRPMQLRPLMSRPLFLKQILAGLLLLSLFVLSGCAGRQLRNLQEENEILQRENAQLIDRLESATRESARLSRDIRTALDRAGDYENLTELEQQHHALRQENEQLRRLIAELEAAARDEFTAPPDELRDLAPGPVLREPPRPDAEAVQRFRRDVGERSLPRDPHNGFTDVATVTAEPLAPPEPRSPLATSGILVEQHNGTRRYYDAIVNRATPRAVYLLIELPRVGPAEMYLVVHERYPRTEEPLLLQRITVSGERGAISLPVGAGFVERIQDAEYRVETVRFPFTTAVDAAVRTAIESDAPILELSGSSVHVERPLSNTERRAMANVLYAYAALSAAAR